MRPKWRRKKRKWRKIKRASAHHLRIAGASSGGREDIASRLTESLFLHLLRDETGGFVYGCGVTAASCSPLKILGAQGPWARVPKGGGPGGIV